MDAAVAAIPGGVGPEKQKFGKQKAESQSCRGSGGREAGRDMGLWGLGCGPQSPRFRGGWGG